MSITGNALPYLAELHLRRQERVCNCRRQDSESDSAGHELWCDIGYSPQPTDDPRIENTE